MDNYLDHTLEISSAEIDLWGELKPSSLLAICQDIAYVHSAASGVGFDTLVSQNMAWVLARVKVEIDRMPKWHEQIRIRTWHKRESGIFSLRDYIIYDKEDKPIVRVTSSWLILNLETRRLSRVGRVFSLSQLDCPIGAIEAEAERITTPTDHTPLADHIVGYSDLDLNHHVNNTRYMEWACDSSPMQMQMQMRLKGFTINFNHEARCGEVVSLSTTPQPNYSLVVDGSITERNIFVVALEYTKRII